METLPARDRFETANGKPAAVVAVLTLVPAFLVALVVGLVLAIPGLVLTSLASVPFWLTRD